MKIGIEAQRLFRRKKHGMEIVALEIIRQLQLCDHNNNYILFVKNDCDDQCIKATENFSIKKIEAEPYPYWEQLCLPNEIKKSKPDILHCTANTAPLFCKTPMIVTIHDVIYLESVNFSGSSYQNFGNLYRRFIVPRAAKKASVIITVSEFEKKNIAQRLGIPENKIRVVYNGVNSQFRYITDKGTLNSFRNKYHLPENYLLHIGNTSPRKNTIGVLKAYHIYTTNTQDVLPLVISNCKREFIIELLKEINAIDLINKIKILDYLSFNDIPYLYNCAAVFLYPSHREGFGMPVIESMACGTPVITSNNSALPEVAGGAACLINSENPHEIFSEICRLLTDKEFYNFKREQGFKNATRFTWKESAEKTLAVYNELNQNKS